MKWLFVLSFVLLVPHCWSATVKKCIECQQCEIHRQLKAICKLESETRCLKFVGLDKNSKFVGFLDVIKGYCLNNYIVNA